MLKNRVSSTVFITCGIWKKESNIAKALCTASERIRLVEKLTATGCDEIATITRTWKEAMWLQEKLHNEQSAYDMYRYLPNYMYQ